MQIISQKSKIMLAVLFGIKCKKKCSQSLIILNKVLALSVRAYRTIDPNGLNFHEEAIINLFNCTVLPAILPF